MKLGLIAIDQYDNTYYIDQEPPRKYLLRYFGRQHAAKMYVDRENKKCVHVGYVIAGHWLHVYEVHSWTPPRTRRSDRR